MKNFKLLFSSIALLAFICIGCKKEAFKEPVKSQKTSFDPSLKISSDGRMLIFKTRNDYDNIVNNPSSEVRKEFLSKVAEMNHTTFNEKKRLLRVEESTVGVDPEVIDGEEFLNNILNEDKIVQIEDKLYLVDVEEEKVLVLGSENLENYDRLAAEDESFLSIRRFSTNDQVLDAVNGIDVNAASSCGGVGGGEYFTNNVEVAPNIYMGASVKFWRAGIYFLLSARCQVGQGAGVFTMYLEANGPQAWARKRPCNAGDVSTSPAGVKRSGQSSYYQWNFHEGSRSLNGYYLFARVRLVKQPPGQSPITYVTNYAGRNISSPY